MPATLAAKTHMQETTNTLEFLSLRVDVLEKQIASLISDYTTDSKTTKKSKKKNSTNEPHNENKKKRLSGYILFGKAERENVKNKLTTNTNDTIKVKSTDVMKTLGKLWKELPEHQRTAWNEKAKNTPITDL
tara:strand:+ start:1740 stop:2135 length:396 start_codon:yes stop_codon:yes gene_type:complete